MRKLFSNLFALALALILPAPNAISIQQFSASVTPPFQGPASHARIPEATEPSTDEETKWWREFCEAARKFAAAVERKDLARRSRPGGMLDEDDDGLSNKERDKLNAAIETARQNYSRLLQEQQDKSYRAPIRDTSPTMLNKPFPG